jgi:hypothetical protein
VSFPGAIFFNPKKIFLKVPHSYQKRQKIRGYFLEIFWDFWGFLRDILGFVGDILDNVIFYKRKKPF